ncbi:hypothetical protein K438DRAFT_1866490 [Mycena galopus ATCC 62051]|nr:hypothetical protein K438DRAFT_1866490 [Mycena galopus ATCC 62051]
MCTCPLSLSLAPDPLRTALKTTIAAFLVAFVVLIPLPCHRRAQLPDAAHYRLTLSNIECECDNLVVHDRGYRARMDSVSASTSSASSPGGGCARPSSRGRAAASSTSPCGGGSPQSFIAAYILKGHRFDIIQHFGCRPTTYISLPAILLVWAPHLVVLRAPPHVPVPAALCAHPVAVPAPHGHGAIADSLGNLRQRRQHVLHHQPCAPPLGLLALRAQRLLRRRPLTVPVHPPPVHPSGAVGLDGLLLDCAHLRGALLRVLCVRALDAVKVDRACRAVVGRGVRRVDARNEEADASAGGGRCALCD